jgi:hypothetical protein
VSEKAKKKFTQPREDDEDSMDHCVCDHPVQVDEQTRDEELPPATGGVEH